MFESRFIIKDDNSFDKIPLGNGKFWDFTELQKEKGRTWHSRPYEYAFVVDEMVRAYGLGMIKLDYVLDLACGAKHPGYMAIANIEEVKRILAVDLDNKLLTNGIDHAKVYKLICDATNAGFKGEYFDAVSCVSAIEHMQNWEDCIYEISRLLKCGGMAFVTIDISTDMSKTMQHHIDDKIPLDYISIFYSAGMYLCGGHNDELQHDAVDSICSKYPLVINKSEFLGGQHNDLKTFKMVLKKGG